MEDVFADSPFPRPLALITGAAGGMGRACAHRFAGTHRLLLTDLNQAALDALADELALAHGISAETIAGDIADDAVIAAIAGSADDTGLSLLVHTAGLSPALANWQTIVRVNLVGTAKLFQAIEPLLRPGLVGIFMSSTARCFVDPPNTVLRKELDDPLAPNADDRLASLLGDDDGQRCVNAYAYTKWWIHDAVAKRAADWAAKGARILSISPGFVLTAMTRKELELRPDMRDLLRQTPVGRWGSADDIANLVEFLQSDRASFVTGADIVIDGGLSARILSRT